MPGPWVDPDPRLPGPPRAEGPERQHEGVAQVVAPATWVVDGHGPRRGQAEREGPQLLEQLRGMLPRGARTASGPTRAWRIAVWVVTVMEAPNQTTDGVKPPFGVG